MTTLAPALGAHHDPSPDSSPSARASISIQVQPSAAHLRSLKPPSRRADLPRAAKRDYLL